MGRWHAFVTKPVTGVPLWMLSQIAILNFSFSLVSLLYYLLQANPTGVILTYLAAAGSVLVSYVKARADASKLDANVGLLTRVERYIVLIPGLIFNLPLPVLIIIAILANFTALQRILRVRRDAHRRLSPISGVNHANLTRRF